MGRGVLLALALLGACSIPDGPFSRNTEVALPPGGEPEGPVFVADVRLETGHEDLACRTCHWGDRADVGERSVPQSTCTTSGCQTDEGPREIHYRGATFQHRSHADTAAIEMQCAGCHSHATGPEPLSADGDACALCHADQIDGANPGDCAICHTRPDALAVTSQGVNLRHDQLPWVSRSCVRCHYDVATPPVGVDEARCLECHRAPDPYEVGPNGEAEDPHPDHAGINCSACHESRLHSIRAMSTAVRLECAHCHNPIHAVEISPEWPGTPTCNACHREVHHEQQRLVLGFVPGLADASPSQKFMDGMTCRSCHAPLAGEGAEGEGLRGTRDACTGCHSREFARVPGWWEEGLRVREAQTRAYLRRAEGTLANASDSVQSTLRHATEAVDLVAAAHGVHNLTLAHQVYETSLRRAAEAYRQSGVDAPAVPNLGRSPRMGLCTFCHYRLGETTLTGNMPRDFHAALSAARGG